MGKEFLRTSLPQPLNKSASSMIIYQERCFFFQVWLGLPVIMLVVAVLLVILPVLVRPGPSLAALAMISMGVPVYVCLVMSSPWKLRPAILDQWSGEGCAIDLYSSYK